MINFISNFQNITKNSGKKLTKNKYMSEYLLSSFRNIFLNN